MAKDREREAARKLFVELGKSQKEIAYDLDLAEKTVGEWVKKYHWREQRDARLNSSDNRAENIKRIIAKLSESTLEIISAINTAEAQGDNEGILVLEKKRMSIAHEIGIYQKALEKLEKNFKIGLTTYVEVMDDIFDGLRTFDSQLYVKTLAFQKQHLQNIAQKLG